MSLKSVYRMCAIYFPLPACNCYWHQRRWGRELRVYFAHDMVIRRLKIEHQSQYLEFNDCLPSSLLFCTALVTCTSSFLFTSYTSSFLFTSSWQEFDIAFLPLFLSPVPSTLTLYYLSLFYIFACGSCGAGLCNTLWVLWTIPTSPSCQNAKDVWREEKPIGVTSSVCSHTQTSRDTRSADRV